MPNDLVSMSWEGPNSRGNEAFEPMRRFVRNVETGFREGSKGMTGTFQYLGDTEWIIKILDGKRKSVKSEENPECLMTPLLRESIKRMLKEERRPGSPSPTECE
jgi:hypothetical protein